MAEWIDELRRDHVWGPSDPLFPATAMGLGDEGGFVGIGLSRHAWATSEPIRTIFRRSFAAAGLPYSNPHSFRDMLVRHGMALGLSPEGLKAWSQNLGHADVMTTLTSYGSVPMHRQGALIRAAGQGRDAATLDDPVALELLDRLVSRRAATAR